MPRTLCLPALLLLVVHPSLAGAFPPADRGDEDEPTLRGKTVSEWAARLQEGKTVKQRRGALLALELIGPRKSRKVLPAVVTALREDPDETIREAAALTLGNLCTRVREDRLEGFRFDQVRIPLATALRTDRSAAVRRAAASSLGLLGEEARAAVGALAGALQDRDPDTRTAAADALRRLGKDAREALPDLQRALADRKLEALTRLQAALALGRIGAPNALPALPVLKDVLADTGSPAEVRKAAAQTLGVLGKDAPEAVPALGAALADPDPEVRRAAAAGLDQVGAEARPALPALRRALKDDDRYVRCLALHAIGRLGKDLGGEGRPVVAAVLASLGDSVLEVRVAAIETLGALGAEGLGVDKQGVVERLEAIRSRDGRKPVREAAEQALKRIEARP